MLALPTFAYIPFINFREQGLLFRIPIACQRLTNLRDKILLRDRDVVLL